MGPPGLRAGGVADMRSKVFIHSGADARSSLKLLALGLLVIFLGVSPLGARRVARSESLSFASSRLRVSPMGSPGVACSESTGGANVAQAAAASYRFAAFGDFGQPTPGVAAVAEMVHSWNVDAILALGDVNYGSANVASLDRAVGQYYHSYIGDYQGTYGDGASVNRFFPVIGNHDWPGSREESLQYYLDYFALPGDGFQNTSGNERYYEFRIGNVHFFALHSNLQERDGRKQNSDQAAWLRDRLQASNSEFKVVYFHEPPYNSGWEHGDNVDMQWPFVEWGVDAVLSGHEHIYERLDREDLPYFISGLGGVSKYGSNQRHPGSQVLYTEDFGALLITAEPHRLTFEFHPVRGNGVPIDRYVIQKAPEPGALFPFSIALLAALHLFRTAKVRGHQLV